MAPSVKGLLSFCVAASVLLAAPRVLAQEPEGAAARAYDRGAAALREGDNAAAARAFAEADRIAPHPTTLAEALRAALDADDFDLVRTLVVRAESRASTPDLVRLLAEARRALPVHAPAVVAPMGTVQLEAPAPCTFVGGERTLVLPVGLQPIAVRCGAATGRTVVAPTAGSHQLVRVEYKPRRGPPLWVPIALSGAAFAGLAFGILRGSYAGDRSAELTANDCRAVGSAACRDVASRGHAAQVQANVGFVVAGVLASAAIGTAIWYRGASVSFAASPQHAALHVALRWQ